jgi:hypothetical protein
MQYVWRPPTAMSTASLTPGTLVGAVTSFKPPPISPVKIPGYSPQQSTPPVLRRAQAEFAPTATFVASVSPVMAMPEGLGLLQSPFFQHPRSPLLLFPQHETFPSPWTAHTLAPPTETWTTEATEDTGVGVGTATTCPVPVPQKV